MTPDSRKGRSFGKGDLLSDANTLDTYVHQQGTSDQPSRATEPVGGLCYPTPGPGYVAVFDDGGPREVWDVVGFDRAGNPLIEVGPRGQKVIARADAFPRYLYQGWARLLGVAA